MPKGLDSPDAAKQMQHVSGDDSAALNVARALRTLFTETRKGVRSPSVDWLIYFEYSDAHFASRLVRPLQQYVEVFFLRLSSAKIQTVLYRIIVALAKTIAWWRFVDIYIYI